MGSKGSGGGSDSGRTSLRRPREQAELLQVRDQQAIPIERDDEAAARELFQRTRHRFTCRADLEREFASTLSPPGQTIRAPSTS